MTGIGRRGAVLSHPVLKYGVVAHLVERRFCTAEVRGSSPLVSTPDFSTGHSGGKEFESPRVHQSISEHSEEEEKVDVKTVWAEVKGIEKDREAIDKKVDGYLKELKY